MTGRRVLITGGGGFVGSHLARGLARLGHRVTALDSGFDAASSEQLRDVTRLVSSLTVEALAASNKDFDLVIHAAAVTTSPEELGQTDAEHIKRNLDLLLDTLHFAQRKGVAELVFVSSSGVFSPDDASECLLETTVPTATSAYALAKRGSELIVRGAASTALATVTIRLGYVYGPYERPRATRTGVSLVRLWLDRAERGDPIIVRTPEARRDWTYAGDLAQALVSALSLIPRRPLIHLGSGVAVSDLELAQAIAANLPTARIEVEPRQETPALKPPMASTHPLPMIWTSLADGIAATRATLVGA